MRVETINGLIFGTFSGDVEPLYDYLGPQVVGSFERVASREFRVLGYYSQWLSSNWKLYCENATDPYHATILHAWATKLKLNRFTMEGAIEMGHEGWVREGWHQLSWSKMATDKGGEVYDRSEFRSGTDSFDAFGLHDTSIIEQWDEYGDGITTFIQTVFPNFVFQQIHNTLATRVLVPRGPEGSELIWTILGFADDDEAGGMQGAVAPFERALRERGGEILLSHQPVEISFDGERASGFVAVSDNHLALEVRAPVSVISYPLWSALPLLPPERRPPPPATPPPGPSTGGRAAPAPPPSPSSTSQYWQRSSTS